MDNTSGFLGGLLRMAAGKRHERASQALRESLAGLGDIDPVERVRLVAARTAALFAQHQDPASRALLLHAVEAEAATLLPAIAQRVAEAPLPLANDVNDDALAADKLLKTLAATWTRLAEQLAAGGARPPTVPLARAHADALRGAAGALFQRHLLAYRAYAPASESSWLALHRIHASARDAGLARQADGGVAVEHHYHAALLLALADPMKFPRSALPLLQEQAERFAPLVRLYPTNGHELPESASLFLVCPQEGRPARPLARAEAIVQADGFILDANPAVANLRKDIFDRERRAAERGEATPELALLGNLLSMWRGHPHRRFSRNRFKPRGDLVSGIDGLVLALSGGALMRRHTDHPAPAVGDHPAPATGDQPAPATGDPLSPAASGGVAPAPARPAVSEWAITDESPDGFGVRFLKGESGALDVGDIVAFRARERSRVHVCLVRRVSNCGPTRLELGLQELAPAVHAFRLPAAAGAAAGPASDAVLLPKMPCYRNIPGLIVRPGSISLGQRFVVNGNDGGKVSLSVARLLQGGARGELYALEAGVVG